jgi:glycosyltransferase involved in cell wall biosynthesis
MKLVFIITGLPTGGAQIMLLKLLQNIDRSRFEPSVISLTTTGEIGPRIEALGIPVHALSMRPRFPNPLKLIQLTELIRRFKPDVVHTWMYHADLMGGMAARIVGIRQLSWCIRHSDLSTDMTKPLTLWVVRLCAILSRWLPRKIITCSKRAKSIHIETGYSAEKFTVIPNGFDLSHFAPHAAARAAVRAELKLHSDVLLVGLIARFHPQKNHAGFIDAAARVARVLPKVNFLLVGSGVDSGNTDLVKLIAESGVGDRFHLLGRREDIPLLMAALDLLASSSSWGEAFPNVLGEAMASGVPCVVTDVGDSAEIVADTGRVVAPDDMEGLAKYIVEFLSQPDLRMFLGQRARQRAHEHYEIGKITRQYENFYFGLVGKA